MKLLRTHDLKNQDRELTSKLSYEISERYGVDQRLASEMAWDLVEMIAAVDGNLETLDKYILH